MNTIQEVVCLGSAGMTVFDQHGYMQLGKEAITLWPLKSFPKNLSCFGCNHISDEDSPKFQLFFEFYVPGMRDNDYKVTYSRKYDEKKDKGQIYLFQE